MSDIAERLLVAIAKRAEAANADDLSSEYSWHTIQCGYRQREWGEPCECGVPAQVKADCAADREEVEDCMEILADSATRHPELLAFVDRTLARLARGYGLEET